MARERRDAPPPRRDERSRVTEVRERPGPRLRENTWIWLLALGVLALLLLFVYLVAAADEEEQAERQPATAADREAGDEGILVVVPDLVGMSYAEAHAAAEAEGLIADSAPVEADEPQGTVVGQSPAAGSEVAPTRNVELAVSVGGEPRPSERIPDVTGPDAEEARRIAIETGFTVRTADRDAPTAEEVGEVILQEPAAGTTAPVLTQITLYVGR